MATSSPDVRKTPLDRHRTASTLVRVFIALGAVSLLLAYSQQESAFLLNAWSAVFGTCLGLIAVVVAYDTSISRRRQQLWRNTRLVVARSLAQELGLLLETLTWNLDGNYPSHGAQVERAIVTPNLDGYPGFSRRVEYVLTYLRRFEGDWRMQVPHPQDSEQVQTGETLANVYLSVLDHRRLSDYRQLLSPLAPIADETIEVLEAAEEFLAAAWLAGQSAIAARAGEMRNTEFMQEFPEVILKLRALYYALCVDYTRASQVEVA